LFSAFFLPLIVSVLSGAAGALGIGGGGVFLLYLMVFANVEQLKAQGMNLIFFLPIALTAIFIHLKNRLIDRYAVLVTVPFGLLGAWLGIKTASLLEGDTLRLLFGLILAAVGFHELFKKTSF